MALTWMLSMACGVEPSDSLPGLSLGEVVVTGSSARQRLENVRLGAERLELSRLVQAPSFAGENDIIKSLALLPGVNGEGDGGGGFEVRGGNASQNLVLLDGMTLYNPSHVMGIFSTFNDNALGGATLYKGPVPAMYGGATSSVLETSLASGSMEAYHGTASVGILSARLGMEGPVVKDRLSFAVNARRSYVDAFLKMVPQYRGTIMNFYDVTAKVRYRQSAANIIDGSFFISRDNMAISNVMGLYWGNKGASLNWLARVGDNLSVSTTAALTHSDPKMEMSVMDLDQVMLTYIHSYSINSRVRMAVSGSHAVEAGVRSELFNVKSAEWAIGSRTEKEVRSLWENSAWADYTGRLSQCVELSAGVRLSVASALSGRRFHAFSTLSDAVNQFDAHTYVNLEPRISVKYDISPLNNIKAGVGTSTQNIHSIRSGDTTFPFDRCALTSAIVKPERAIHCGLGYAGMTPGGEYDWQAEAYYKSIDNVYDFMDGRGMFSDVILENIILGGEGRGYGVELMIRRNTGRLTGWISYTLSHTETRIPGINEGKWYDATNDRRHDLSVTGTYRMNDNWILAGSWVCSSGRPLTAPDVKYEIAGETCYYYSRRNAYKTPPVHRLDISATYTHVGDRFTYQWAFGIYNAYCRYNPYVVYFEDDPTKPSGTRAVQQSLFGLIPSVSYTLKF